MAVTTACGGWRAISSERLAASGLLNHPNRCLNGHPLGPTQVLVGHVACLGHRADTAGNGRFARKVIVHCKHERARRLSPTPPQLLSQAADNDLIVNDDDMRRAIAAALAIN